MGGGKSSLGDAKSSLGVVQVSRGADKARSQPPLITSGSGSDFTNNSRGPTPSQQQSMGSHSASGRYDAPLSRTYYVCPTLSDTALED